MEENKNLELESIQENEEKSSFDFATIYTVLILNWKWFVLSLIICMGAAHIYCAMQRQYTNLQPNS